MAVRLQKLEQQVECLAGSVASVEVRTKSTYHPADLHRCRHGVNVCWQVLECVQIAVPQRLFLQPQAVEMHLAAGHPVLQGLPAKYQRLGWEQSLQSCAVAIHPTPSHSLLLLHFGCVAVLLCTMAWHVLGATTGQGAHGVLCRAGAGQQAEQAAEQHPHRCAAGVAGHQRQPQE